MQTINGYSFCRVFSHQTSECIVLAECQCKYCKEKGHTTKHCPKLKLKNQRVLQSQQSKIVRYDSEFPEIPGSKSVAVSDGQKIAMVNFIINEKKQADHQAYLERESRRQIKKDREERLAQIKEEKHIQNMIEKWGSHRWYNMVYHTEDDCETAQDLRDKEEEFEYQREILYEIREEQDQLHYEENKKKETAYIEETTKDMSAKTKAQWLRGYEWEKELEDDYSMERESMAFYSSFERRREQAEADQKRLEEWNKKNNK